MKLSVYIAGPMTGYPEHNFPAFHAAAEAWRKRGWDVQNPAEMDDPNLSHEELAAVPWEDYMARDLAILAKCHAIALLPGWENSRGARVEEAVARLMGKRVFLANHPARHPVVDHEFYESNGGCCLLPDYMHLKGWLNAT